MRAIDFAKPSDKSHFTITSISAPAGLLSHLPSPLSSESRFVKEHKGFCPKSLILLLVSEKMPMASSKGILIAYTDEFDMELEARGRREAERMRDGREVRLVGVQNPPAHQKK